MDTLRQYILSIICIVVVCGILQMLIPKGMVRNLLKVISGLVVTITVLTPFLNEQILRWDYSLERMLTENTMAVLNGESAASDLLKQRISTETESYILSKASALNANLTVDVDLASEFPNVPVAVTIKGNISPYAQKQLSAYLADDLGIPEEKQIWIS